MSEEISLTIAETNELRKKLGLGPLKIGSDSQTEILKSVEIHPKKLDKTQDRDTDEGKRLFQEISGGGGILDDIIGSDAESVDNSAKMQRKDVSQTDSSRSDLSNSSDCSDSE